MDDDENPARPLEDELGQANYNIAIQQLPELINNNQLIHGQRPDTMQWRLQRMKTIRTLDELRKKLDLICVGANYGKGVGSGAQLSGAVTSIIGAILALKKSPSAATVMNVGSLINHSGALVEGLSNIVESFVSAEYLREVKTILDEDQRLSQPLREWLFFSRNLDTNMRIIFGSDLDSAVQNNVLKVFSEFTRLYTTTKGFHATLEVMEKGEYAMHIGTDVNIDKLLKFSRELDVSPELRETIVKLSESFKFLRVAQDGVKVYRNLFGDDDSAGEILPTNQTSIAPANFAGRNAVQDDENEELDSANAPLKAESPSVKAVSAFCAFQAIDIATSVVSLISAVMIIKDGKSKFSDAMKQVSYLLQTELESIDELN